MNINTKYSILISTALSFMLLGIRYHYYTWGLPVAGISGILGGAMLIVILTKVTKESTDNNIDLDNIPTGIITMSEQTVYSIAQSAIICGRFYENTARARRVFENTNSELAKLDKYLQTVAYMQTSDNLAGARALYEATEALADSSLETLLNLLDDSGLPPYYQDKLKADIKKYQG